MNFYPRSATVVAESDVVAYEMLRNVLDIMMKNKTFKAQIDETYRRRALENHLRGVPMFADLAPDFHRAFERKPSSCNASRRDRLSRVREIQRTVLSRSHRLREKFRKIIRAANSSLRTFRAAIISVKSACSAAAFARRTARRSTTSKSFASPAMTFAKWWSAFPRCAAGSSLSLKSAASPISSARNDPRRAH